MAETWAFPDSDRWGEPRERRQGSHPFESRCFRSSAFTMAASSSANSMLGCPPMGGSTIAGSPVNRRTPSKSHPIPALRRTAELP